MLIPNLKSLRISQVMLRCTLTLSDDVLEQISTSAPPDEDEDNVFVYSGKIDNIRHFRVGVVSRIKKGKDNCAIGFNCRPEGVGRLSKTHPAYLHSKT